MLWMYGEASEKTTFRYKGPLVVLEWDVSDWSCEATLLIRKCSVSQEHLMKGAL